MPDTFNGIYMDPPWLERGGGQCKRGADRHYPLMKTPDILATIRFCPVWRPAVDAHLYMWVTNNFLQDGLYVMSGLGFRYITNLVWKKERAGIGQYFRGEHELLLFGVRGSGFNVRTRDRTITTGALFNAERPMKGGKRIHSAKPLRAYDIIEARTFGPYLEMFHAGQCVGRKNWTQWGPENHRPLEVVDNSRPAEKRA